MTVADKCPKCDTVLSADVFAGLCPKCLGQLGFSPPTNMARDSGLLRLGDYELLEEIARGGMGVVYRARQLSLNRIVAVKVVLHGPFASGEFVRRFRTEAEAAAALRHPNIVSIHEVGEHDGHHFLSMEYIEGQNFAELVREKPLPAHRAAVYLKTIAEAVQHAHQRGVLHRDLKPSNVLLDAFDQPRVMDFGLAKLVNHDAELTTTGQVLGSPNHMPPEQAAGQFTDSSPQSDVYSLGAILYQLLTSRPPFQGETLQEILTQVQNTEPIPPQRLNPSVPADLQTICLKCLQKEPARRYRSAQELADDLGHFLAGEPIHARPVPLLERAWLWCRRRPVFAALSAALIVTVAFGLAGILWQWRRAEMHAQGESSQRRFAEEEATTLRLNLYAADVSLAAQAIQRGDYGLARRTLSALKPRAGEEDLREFAWRYLWSQCQGDQLATLTGHEWIVSCAAFSPDGRMIATGSQDRTVKVWDAVRLELTATLSAATGNVWSVAFSPESDLLITAGVGGIRLWRTDTWQFVTNFPGQIAAVARTGSLMAVSESSPTDWWHPRGPVSLWDYRTGKKLRELERPGGSLALSPDGRRLAVGGFPSGMELFDVESGNLFRTIQTSNSIWSVAFSPDGNQLVTTAGSREPTVWDLSRPLPPRTLKGHFLTVWSANYSIDGATIVTTGSDQTVRLWDAATLQLKSILRGHDHEVWCAAISPDGKRIVTGGKDQKVMLWSGESRPQPDRLPNRNERRPVFSRDGTQIVTTTVTNSGTPSALWNVRELTLLAHIPGRPALGFSLDGQRVVRWSEDGLALEAWCPKDLSTTRILLEDVKHRTGPFDWQGFSADGNIFFAIDSAGLVRFWEASSGKLAGIFQGFPSPSHAAALGHDGRFFALASGQESVVRLFDRSSGRETRLVGHRDIVNGLAFSPDGTMLASGSLDGTIRLWNTATGKQLRSLPGHMEEASDVAFSPDGRTLASVNLKHSIKLWHIATGRELLLLNFPRAGNSLQFSPDGRYLAVNTDENSIRLFNAPLLEESNQIIR